MKTSVLCPKCGNNLDYDESSCVYFCSSCGAKFRGGNAGARTQAQPSASYDPPPGGFASQNGAAMNYCPNCGAKIPAGAGRCPVCGYANYPVPAAAGYPGPGAYVPEKKKNGLKLAAFVLCILSTIGIGWLLIPLLWCIPLTERVYRAYTGEKPMTDGVAVCVLIFMNLIAGILLLVDD